MGSQFDMASPGRQLLVDSSLGDAGRISPFKPIKIGVVGAGNVGASTTYALMLSGLAAEIVVIDINQAKAEGEAMDISHAAPLAHQTRVYAGQYEDLKDSSLVIITAGANQKPGQTRLELLQVNFDIFKAIVPRIVANAPDCFLLVATNPVDVLTYAAVKLSGFPAHRVIGSGTVLDSARLKNEISSLFQISPKSVHASVLGEHGDSEVAAFSLVTIQGMRLQDFCEGGDIPYDATALQKCAERTKRAAYEIILRKGATDYAIASGLTYIATALLRNENSLLTVSRLGSYAGVDDVCLSVPNKVNRNGAHMISRLRLAPEEETALRESALRIKEAIKTLEFPQAV